jgi:hypothetical protein
MTQDTSGGSGGSAQTAGRCVPSSVQPQEASAKEIANSLHGQTSEQERRVGVDPIASDLAMFCRRT